MKLLKVVSCLFIVWAFVTWYNQVSFWFVTGFWPSEPFIVFDSKWIESTRYTLPYLDSPRYRGTEFMGLNQIITWLGGVNKGICLFIIGIVIFLIAEFFSKVKWHKDTN